jgi:hypothetical protein
MLNNRVVRYVWMGVALMICLALLAETLALIFAR